MEQPNSWRGRRENPEQLAMRAQEAGLNPFDTMVAAVKPEYVRELAQHLDVLRALEEAKWPTEESECDAVGDKVGYGAAEMAAVSQYQRALMKEKEGGTIH